MAIHFFDTDIAAKYGLNEAIILENLHYWILHNKANETHYYDGNTWTYNSLKAFQDIFPYFTKNQIEYCIKKLVDQGLIVTGNYNETTYNRTKWYAFTELGKELYPDLKDEKEDEKIQKCISENSEMDSGKFRNGIRKIQKSYNIYNNKYIYNTDNKPDDKHILENEQIENDLENTHSVDDVELVVQKWNELDEFGIKKIIRLPKNSPRYRSLGARLKEFGVEEVLKAIDMIKESDYLQGKCNEWSITFDWFVKKSNFYKVIEGNYTNRNTTIFDGIQTDDFNPVESFNYIFKAYPNQRNAYKAKNQFALILRKTTPDKRNETCANIYAAMMKYLKNCESQRIKQVEDFCDWIKSYDYWYSKE